MLILLIRRMFFWLTYTPRRWGVFVFVLAFLFRLLFCMVVFGWLSTQVHTTWRWSLNDGYDTIASNLVSFGVYGFSPGIPTAQRLPVYPLFLAGIMRWSGEYFVFWTQVVQSVVSAGSVWLTFQLAYRLCSMRAGIITSLFCAFYPNWILYAARPFTETVFTFLVLAFLTCFTRALITYPRVLSTVGAGIFLGLSLLTRGTMVLYLFWFAFMSLVVSPFRNRRFYQVLLVVGLIAGTVMLPWMARNYLRSNRFIPLTSLSSDAAIHGLYVADHYFNDTRRGLDLDEAGHALRREVLNALSREPADEDNPIAWELKQEKCCQQFWRDTIWARPWHYTLMFARNTIALWFLSFHGGTTVLAAVIHLPLVLLFIWALISPSSRTKGAGHIVLTLTILYFVWFHALIYPHQRYVTPIIPLLLILFLGSKARLAQWLVGVEEAAD